MILIRNKTEAEKFRLFAVQTEKMTRKTKAIVNFIPIAVKRYRQLLKNLLAFTEDQMAKDLMNQYTNSKEIPWVDILEVAPKLNETVTDFTFLSYTSRVTDIAVLKALAKSFPECDYFEIGSLRGESLINVLPNTNSTTGLSLSKDEMRELGLPEDMVVTDSILVKSNEKLTQIRHNSLTFDYSKLNKKFDLIFIDGDHSTDAVKVDTANAFKLLKDENSIIIWHDFGYNYSDQRPEVIAGALQGAPKEAHPYIYRISNSLCGIYTKRKLKTISDNTNMLSPTKVFDVTLVAKSV